MADLTQPCAVCGTLFKAWRKDHRYCSPRCRLAAFSQKRAQARPERDAKVRLLLRTALEAVQEARELLTDSTDNPTNQGG